MQTPGFMPDKFEVMNKSDVDLWFEENMASRVKYGVYNPHSEGTLNHIALEYMISELTNSGIKVALVAVPHHPQVYDYLQPGQIDGHNHTLDYFEEEYGTSIVNWFWESWESNNFRDKNHLGNKGRDYYCDRISIEIDKILEN